MARLSKIAKLVAAGSEDKVENIFIQNLKATIENTQSEYRPSTFYKPSGVGGCIRSMYFQRVGNVLQQKSDSNLIAMGESGTFRHEVIQEYLVKMSERLADEEFLWVNVEKYLEENPVEGTTVDANFKKNDYETKCKNSNLQLSFLCDGLVMLKGKPTILEIKTETMFKYNKHTEPYEEHKMQATCYALCLGVDQVLFLYENRDTFDKKAYLFEVTAEWKQKVVDKISTCEWFVEQGAAPQEYCSSNYCPYCKGPGKEMV